MSSSVGNKKLDKRTEILICASLIVFSAACVFVSVYLPLTFKPGNNFTPKCDTRGKGEVWDVNVHQCVKKCSGQWSRSLQNCVKCDIDGYNWDDEKQECVIEACSPAPSVDQVTGNIVNSDHFFDGAVSQCGQGTGAQLDVLCRLSGWDQGFDASDKKCKRLVECGTQACDADYCTSSTVMSTVSNGKPIYKVKNDAGNMCVNPTKDQVGNMCKSIENCTWISPNCFRQPPSVQNTGAMTVVGDPKPTTSLIQGTLRHSLLNYPADMPILYNYTLQKEGSTVIAAGGQCVSGPPTFDDQNHTVTTPFSINISGETAIPPGNYNMLITGSPSWAPNSGMYALENAPFAVTLFPTEAGAGVSATLNPSFSLELAESLATSHGWLTSVSNTMLNYPWFKPVQEGDTDTVLLGSPGSSSSVLVVGCAPSYCDVTQSESVKQKMVVLAWQSVPVPTTLPNTCALYGEDASYNPDDYEVRYELSSYMVDAVGTTVVKVLMSSSYVLQDAAKPVRFFVDSVKVNTNVQYVLGAYLTAKDRSESTTYETASCKSELQYVTLNTGEYTETFCRGLKYPSSNLPPFMWKDNVSGMCMWSSDERPAQDFYCMFGDGINAPATPFDPNNIKLSSGQECRSLDTQWPSRSQNDDHPFDPALANPTPSSNAYCLDGLEQQARVSCSKTVPLSATSIKLSEDDFKTRVANAVNFNEDHKVMDTLPHHDAISSPSQLSTLWSTVYNNCGPSTDPSKWGKFKANCDDGDAACKQYAMASGCDDGRNYCQNRNWSKLSGDSSSASSYTMWQTTYPEKMNDGENSMCCHTNGAYSVSTSSTASTGRGQCTCAGAYTGSTCDKTPCEGINCNNKGQCVVDTDGSAKCVCDVQYFNVGSTVRPMSFEKDCGNDVNNCKCPTLCHDKTVVPSADNGWCIPFDPLTCNSHGCVMRGDRCDPITGCQECLKYKDPQKGDFSCAPIK